MNIYKQEKLHIKYGRVVLFLVISLGISLYSCSDVPINDMAKIDQEKTSDSSKNDELFFQINENELSYNNNIFHLEKKISDNMKIYRNKNKHLLHLKAVIDTTIINTVDTLTSLTTDSWIDIEDDVYGVTKKRNYQSSEYQYTEEFNGKFGYYNDQLFEFHGVGRQVIRYNNIPIPSDSEYDKITLNLETWEISDARNGNVNFTLVDPNFNIGTENHFNKIEFGQSIANLFYDKSFSSVDNTEITNQQTLDIIQNFIENHNNTLYLGLRATNESASGSAAYDELLSIEVLIEYTPPPPPGSIPTTPTLSSPEEGSALGRHRDLHWQESEGNPTPEYEVNIFSGSSYNNYIETTETNLSFSSLNLNTNQIYSWRVRAKNSNGTSNWSDVRTFTVVPYVANFNGPSDGPIANGPVTFQAEAAGGNPPYEYQWDRKHRCFNNHNSYCLPGENVWTTDIEDGDTFTFIRSAAIQWLYLRVKVTDSNNATSVLPYSHTVQFY